MKKIFSLKSYFFILILITLLSGCTALQGGGKDDDDDDDDVKKTLSSPVIETSNTDPIARDSYIRINYFPSDATAVYTLDGSEPTLSNGAIYSGSFLLPAINSDSFLLRVRTFKNNYNSSPITEKLFTFQADLPENVYLTSLALSSGTLSPGFDKDIQFYTMNLPYATDSVRVTPATTISGAKITVDGSEVTSGSSSNPIALAVGKNTVVVKVNLYDTVRTYTLSVTRQSLTPSDNNTLSSLSLTGIALSPPFDKTITSYVVVVPYSTGSVEVNGATEDTKATAAVKGKLLPADVALSVGANAVPVKVVSESGVVKTYTINITRQEAGNTDPDNNNLISLDVAGVDLSTIFDKNVTSYTATVPNSVESGIVTAVAESSVATVKIGGNGSPCTVPFAVGVNSVTINVESANGATKIYTITVTRESSGGITDATSLSSLTVSSGTLTPAFSRMTTAYTASVTYATTSVQITALPYDTASSVKIDGYNSPYTRSLEVGDNTINIVVKSTSGATGEYTLVINRDPNGGGLSSNAQLKSLSVSGAALSPAFSSSALAYDCGSVENGVSSVTVSATPDDSKINNMTINGAIVTGTTVRTATVNLAVGNNDIVIVVTPEDVTKPKKTYNITINRKSSSIKGKIIVHAYGYTDIHYWNIVETNSPKLYASTAWPGVDLTDESASQGAGWKGKTFEGTTSISLIFNNNGAGQTGDLSRTEGEWWFKSGKWTEYNPDDLIPPSVTLTSPASGSTLTGVITVAATATDNVGVAKVEFYADNTVIGSDSATPFSCQWDSGNIANGNHVIKAVAYDLAGNTATSDLASIITSNSNKAPVADAGGDRFVKIGTDFTLSGAASYDPNGTIVEYKWVINGTQKTGVTVTHRFDSIGEYAGSLTVKDNEGTTATVSFKITAREANPRLDFREESIYFVITSRFYDGVSSNNRYCRADDNSGNRANNDPPWRGDFKGLIDKLDYIKALGFTSIWITPVVQNRSDYDYHGYHTWDFNKIDARLETPGATYQDLINEVHKRGMKLIQDIVLNHTSRYGAVGMQTVKYWGDRNDPEWGVNGTDPQIKGYYDEYNPNFTYNGLDAEPNSGKPWYNGDLWQSEKPTIWIGSPKDPAESLWGAVAGTVSGKSYKWHHYQWPTLGLFDPTYFHKTWLGNWEDETCQTGTMHEDCVDLNTESAVVQAKLIAAYNKMIDMGVDAFRIDTVKHINRLMFNRRFVPAFKQRGGDNFFMFGEVCTRVNEVWNKNVAPLSTPFYTWKERYTYSSDDATAVHEQYVKEWNNYDTSSQPVSDNHQLNGNDYHTPDYSKNSGLSVIDFPMHWNFKTAGGAFGVKDNDKYYNDATWNVTYVQSHDYSPWEAPNDRSYRAPIEAVVWAEDMTLMWTFRGIPCLYYGDEIQDAKGNLIDVGATMPLANTGRPYFGEHIEGSVSVSDFGVWSNATGSMSTTLNHPLAKHVQALNRIRLEIPALQKGQYSTSGISGTGMAFKKRFTDSSTDSFVLVTISGDAVFSGIPNGKYVDAVTGNTINVTGGTLTASCSGQGNARIYVLDTAKSPAPGKVGTGSNWLK